MGFPKMGTETVNKGDIMQVGSLYSCKWRTSPYSTIERGWDMLMLIRVCYVGDVVGRYVFYDVINRTNRNLGIKLARHCKELTKEAI
jgi:hypothetical protein